MNSETSIIVKVLYFILIGWLLTIVIPLIIQLIVWAFNMMAVTIQRIIHWGKDKYLVEYKDDEGRIYQSIEWL